MPHTRTLTFTPGPSISREALTRTSRVGYEDAGFFHYFNRTQRPLYKFTLQLGPLAKSEVECLSALHAYHQGGKSFFWDGGHYGAVENYNLIGEGNTARRDYFVPNRYVGAGSIAVRTFRPSTGATSNWTTGYSLNPDPGLISFANSTNTIPVSGDDVLARYGCRYRVNFAAEGIRIEEVAAGLFNVELVLTENGLME